MTPPTFTMAASLSFVEVLLTHLLQKGTIAHQQYVNFDGVHRLLIHLSRRMRPDIYI